MNRYKLAVKEVFEDEIHFWYILVIIFFSSWLGLDYVVFSVILTMGLFIITTILVERFLK